MKPLRIFQTYNQNNPKPRFLKGVDPYPIENETLFAENEALIKIRHDDKIPKTINIGVIHHNIKDILSRRHTFLELQSKVSSKPNVQVFSAKKKLGKPNPP